MHFKFRHLQKVIGGFLILTMVIIIVLLAIAARGQRWFQEYRSYYAFFSSAMGLRSGAPVLIKGIESGKIGSITFGPENNVRVEIRIFKQYSDKLREGSTAKVSKPMVGSATLEVLPGPAESALISPESTIPADVVEGQGLDSLIENANSLVKRLENPSGDLMKSLANVESATLAISEALTKKDGTLRQLLERRELYDELTSSAKHLDSVLATLDESSPEIRDAVTSARKGLEEVNKVVLALQKSFFIRGNIEKYLSENSTLVGEGR